MTKRQAIKLLAELLADRANYATMMRYVSEEQNLKLIMNLLRDASRNIALEAFHVFKVFVANPKKPPGIEAILRRNRERLLSFLANFHNDRDGACESASVLTPDEAFIDEKQYVLQIIQSLRPSHSSH